MINSRFFKVVFASMALCLAMTSCYYDNVEELYPNTDCDTTDVSYTLEIRPLLDQSCSYSGCHGGPTPAALLDLNDYSEVKKIADNGQFESRINRDVSDPQLMPPAGKLGSCQIETIEAWINQGALEN
jgi:hypothetical protein